MHSLKHLIGALVMPFNFVLLLVAAGVVLRLIRRPRAARVTWITAALTVYLASTDLVASVLLAPLTRGYTSPLDAPPLTSYVVVLGSSYSPRDDLPVTATLDAEGLRRLVEGVRLLRKIPGARLIVSGGSVDAGQSAPAHGYARMAQALGVSTDSIVVLDRALDTASEARDIKPTVQSQPFLLVTSAEHMRRAMRLFQREGAHPIAAPATRPHDGPFGWIDLMPRANGLRSTEYALHEYAGLAAMALGLD